MSFERKKDLRIFKSQKYPLFHLTWILYFHLVICKFKWFNVLTAFIQSLSCFSWYLTFIVGQSIYRYKYFIMNGPCVAINFFLLELILLKTYIIFLLLFNFECFRCRFYLMQHIHWICMHVKYVYTYTRINLAKFFVETTCVQRFNLMGISQYVYKSCYRKLNTICH